MADNTKIEWCDATVNHWAGCTAISPACDLCYAKRMAARLWGVEWGNGEQRLRFKTAADTLRALDRKARRLGKKLSVFHNSLSDMFDKEVPDEWRMDAFQVMAETPNLIHLVLTKRIGNVQPYTQRDGLAFDLIGDGRVWLGATICNQDEADRDIPKLLAVPAAKRFLSMEPLLGPVSFEGMFANPSDVRDGTNALEELDWVIVGGESGPGARPMHPDWARSLRDQCQTAGVPFLFKQWGEYLHEVPAHIDTEPEVYLSPDGRCADACEAIVAGGSWSGMYKVGKKAAGRLLDGRTWDEVPT